MIIDDVEYLDPPPGYDWQCRRCSHAWCYRGPRVENPKPPRQCAGCRSAYWNEPKTKKAKSTKAKPKEPVTFVNVMPEIQHLPITYEKPQEHPLLKPPPHMRNQPYFAHESEPQPENAITRATLPSPGPDDWSEEETSDTNGAESKADV